MSLETVVETDILVIGGGMAGVFAAVKSSEKGLDVVLVTKDAHALCLSMKRRICY